MSSGSRRPYSSSRAGSQPRSLKKLRVSEIERYCISNGMKQGDWEALQTKAKKVLQSSSDRISVSVHAGADPNAATACIECRVPSESDSGTTYIQHIDFNSTGSRINGHMCDCPSHRKSERPQDAVCKHVVAALMQYSAESSEESDSSPLSSSHASSQYRTATVTPSSTPGRTPYSAPCGSSGMRSGGCDDVWGLLEPLGLMKQALHGYESKRSEFAGSVELHRIVMKIGKDSSSDINICNTVGLGAFRTISTSHAIVKPRKIEDTQKKSWGKNRFLAVWDDMSTNGTHINGSLVKKGTSMELHEGDQIKLGKEEDKVHFIFVRPLSIMRPVALEYTHLTQSWCLQHYPSHYGLSPGCATPGVSQRTESLTEHSGKEKTEDSEEVDSLFGSTIEDTKPAVSVVGSSIVPGQKDTGQPNRSGTLAILERLSHIRTSFKADVSPNL